MNKAFTKNKIIGDDQQSQVRNKELIPDIRQTTCRCTRTLYIPRRTRETTSVRLVSPWLFASDLFLEFCLTGRWWERRATTEEAGGSRQRGQEKGAQEGFSLPHLPRVIAGGEAALAHSPFYMLSRFSSSHIPRRVLAPLLRFCDHSAAGSLYERGRPGRHRLNP